MRLAAALPLLAFTVSCSAAPAVLPRQPPPPGPTAPVTAIAPAPPGPPLPDQWAHIAAIEQGLLPPVRVKGRDVRVSLEARMRELRVPGLGIAVIAGHQVVWAKSYGLADASTGEAVSGATLFQAGSISKPVRPPSRR